MDDLAAFEGKLQSLYAGQEPFASMMTSTMQAAVSVAEEQIVLRTPVNTGLLRGSITTRLRGVPPNLEGVVMTPLPYGLPVETGRAPGRQPPVDAIAYWVKRKGLERGEKAVYQAAFLIARAIGRHGTRGAFMFRDGLVAAKPHVLQLFDDLTGRILEELARE